MDNLRAKSDKELAKIERELKKIYKDANKEISEKWQKYMDGAEKRIAPLEKAYEDAKASGDQDLIKSTGFELGKAKKLETLNNERYKAMVEQTAAKISDANKIALDYVNGKMPGMYAMNYNGTIENIKTDLAEVGVGRYSFDLVDEHTVRNLVMSNASLLPIKDINKAKDIAWNKKIINSQVMQGILQGESISRIASRLSNVTDMDSKAAIRNARTMCTAAENSGRMSGMKEAEEKGIVYEKQWMATHDDRTRTSHGELDGVSIPLDDEFLPDIQYPGDPAGDPAEVYNCRCSMVRKLIGFRSKDGSIVNVDGLDNYEPTYFEELQAAAAEKKESQKDEKSSFNVGTAESLEEANEFGTSLISEIYDRHNEEGGLNRTTAEESNEYIKIVGTDYRNISTETANTINRNIAAYASEYDTPLQKVRTMTKEEALANKDNFATVHHNFETDSAEMLFNPMKCKDEEKLVERIKELEQKGYCVTLQEGKEADYVVTHEFAHSILDVRNTINEKRNFVNADYSKVYSARKEIEAIFDEYAKAVTDIEEKYKAAEFDFIMNPTKENQELASELKEVLVNTRISRYSMANVDEFVAESFTNQKIGAKSNEYAEKAVNTLDKYFRRKQE